jgi:hypothetical protein
MYLGQNMQKTDNVSGCYEPFHLTMLLSVTFQQWRVAFFDAQEGRKQ